MKMGRFGIENHNVWPVAPHATGVIEETNAWHQLMEQWLDLVVDVAWTDSWAIPHAIAYVEEFGRHGASAPPRFYLWP